MIRASSSQQIEKLVGQLADAESSREAAVARLIVIGARAVERLIAVVDSPAPGTARAAALRTLEAIADRRAVGPAVHAMADADPAVAIAAIGVARGFLRSAKGAAIVDAVTAVAMDRHRIEAVRLAAISALRDLEPETIAPLVAALAADPSQTIRAAAGDSPPTARRATRKSTGALAVAAKVAPDIDGDWPADPHDVRDIIVSTSGTAPLPALLRAVERIRDRESSEPAARRREWTQARAAAHVALANRGSRLALYDLRESLERADSPLPVEFLAALTVIGDASCLEPIAAAYARAAEARSGREDWWRQHLADAFHAIAGRERITRRHAVMKRIEKRWGAELAGKAGRAGGAG